jgi:hypothetical protein
VNKEAVMPEGIAPRLPKVGDETTVFGVKVTVVEVVPHSDWSWSITMEAKNGDGFNEEWSVILPTDYHTETGRYAWAVDPVPEVHGS